MKNHSLIENKGYWSGTLFKTLILLAAPITELVGLRYLLHSVLGLRFGFPGFTDYELILPAPLGFFAFMLALEKAKKLDLKFQPTAFGLNLLAVSAFIWVSANQEMSFLWVALLVALIATAFGIWVRPKDIYKNPNVWAICPSLIMVFSLVFYMKYGESIWRTTIYYVEGLIKLILGIMGNDLIEVSAYRSRMRIHHPVITVYLGQGCGGFDGLLFFLAGFSIFAPLNWGLFKLGAWVKNCFLGLLFFLILNAIRIVSLFSLGVIAGQWWGREAALKVIMGVFHTHLGYLLYALGMFIFCHTLVAVVEKRKASRSLTLGTSLKPQIIES